MSEQPSSSPTVLAGEIFDAVNRHDLGEMRAHAHADVVEDFLAVGQFRGVEAVLGFFSQLFTAFPDFTVKVEDITGDDAHALVQWRCKGTFTGTPFQGVHATRRVVELRGCDVMRFEEGRIRHNTIYYDGLTFARQIGMLPREGSSADQAMTAAFNAATDIRMRLSKRARTRHTPVETPPSRVPPS